MKKFLYLFGAACITYSCSTDTHISDLTQRLDELTSNQIASIEQQIAGMQASLPQLQQTSSELKTYIAELQTQADALEKSLNATEKELTELRKSVSDEMTAERANLLAQVESFKQSVTDELTSMKITIEKLQLKDEALEQRITELRAYADAEISATKDWVTVTFATLEQYNSLITEIASLQVDMESMNNSLESLENRINDKIKADISTAVAAAKEELSATLVSEITEAYTAAITTARKELTSAYETAIKTAIEVSETSMRSWINEQLTGYYTIAQTDAKLDALKNDLEKQLSASQSYLETLISNLEATVTEKTEANKEQIAVLRQDLESLSGDVAKNTSSILKNAEEIEKNATTISANTAAIAQNGNDIENNRKLIDENKAAIEANNRLIAENKNSITMLEAAAEANEKNISANAAAIANNAEDISRNSGLIAANASAIADNSTAIAANAADIIKLKADLQTARDEITSAYTQAIETAVTTLRGEFDTKLASEVSTINARIGNEVIAIDNKITALTARVITIGSDVANIKNTIAGMQDDIADLQEQLAALLARIQSVAYIPQFADGMANMTYTDNRGTITAGSAVLDFVITPAEVVTDILKVWNEALSVKGIYTQTRTVVSFIDLPVVSVACDTEGVLSVTVSGANLSNEFFKGNISVSAALIISDGNNDLTSEYITLKPVEVSELATVDPTAITIPDARFKQYLLTNYDDDYNGEISLSEAANIYEINAVGLQIENLTGIEVMTNLTTVNVANNNISNLNLNALKNLVSLTCYGNPIVNFDISNCARLQRCFFLDVSTNAVEGGKFSISGYDQTSLVCSMNNTSFTELSITDCPSLVSLDTRNCNSIKTFTCKGNEKLRTLNFSDSCESIDCSDNAVLASVDIQNIAGLASFVAHDCALTSLNCTRNAELATLNVNNNKLTDLNVQSNEKLVSLECNRNDISTLNTTRNPLLEHFDAHDNNLLSVNVRSNPALTYLDVSNNIGITMINVNANTELKELYCCSNQLTSLDVSNNTALTELDCNSNPLELLNLGNSKVLLLSSFSNGKLYSNTFKVIGNNITHLYVDRNSIKTLDVSECPALQELSCGGNPLELLNLGDSNPTKYYYSSNSHNTTYPYFNDGELSTSTKFKVISSKITRLDVSRNVLQSLDVSECPALEALDCYSNQLTALDVSKNTALTKLSCNSNPLELLNLGDVNPRYYYSSLSDSSYSYPYFYNGKLSTSTKFKIISSKITQLNVGSNKLQSLDVSECPALETLYCYSNQFTELDVSKTNLGNSTSSVPLDCSSMSTLQTLYLKTGWSIKYITTSRSTSYIPSQTEIVYVN